LARLASTPWDLVVVGAGASGAAVALEAARRGHSVALVEQDDIGSGTSSRSSRLIHGGLRYLARGELGLVREGLRARGRLLREAPGLVRSVRFVYPVYRRDPDGPLRVALGLTLYDLLSVGDGLGRHRRWSARRLAREEPQLRTQGLRGAFAYRDAATHDARLTLALAMSAAAAGVQVLPRCRVCVVEPGGLLEVEDRVEGTRCEVKARAVLLACGPWRGLLPDSVRLRTARGSHIAVPARRLAVSAHLALRSPDDGRLIFALPQGAYTVLGTTDRDDDTPPEDTRASSGDVAYLLRAARHHFPQSRLIEADVSGLWAGLRPLLADDPGSHPDQLSRRHSVLECAPAIYALMGGKLTTHRQMADDAIARMAPLLPVAGNPTTSGPLLAGSLAHGAARLRSHGLREADVSQLSGLYGARLERLADLLPAEASAALEETVLRAQIALAAREEWAWTLDDLLLRRLLPGALNLRLAAALAPWAAEALGQELGWSSAEQAQQLRSFRAGLEEELRHAGLELEV
jgi:glycerol-3-phosphate dehydrogenase